MITALAKLFVKNDEDNYRQQYGTLCSMVGIVLNIILFAGKYFAGMVSGSIGIMADAFNNLSDAGSSVITLIGFRFAGKKPDPDHPFGHGRFEYISGLVVSLAIILMGVELGKSSISKILHPEAIDTSLIAFVILLFSVLVKMYMAFYNHRIGKKIDSSAMMATSMDSLSDCIATSVVFISMLIMKFAGLNVDGISGLFVAGFILFAGYNAIKETIGPLLGQPADKEFVEKIEQIVLAHEEIKGIHDLVVHDYGPGRCLISLHAEVPGDCDIFEIHDVIDNVEGELNQKLNCESVIHMDPIEVNNEVVKRLRGEVQEAVKAVDTRISIHDFRMVQGETHTNLIFDAVVPFDVKMSDEQVKEEIVRKVSQINETYHAVVKIDKVYVEM